jgi:hypothetical protein
MYHKNRIITADRNRSGHSKLCFCQECSDFPWIQISDVLPGGAAQQNGQIKKGREVYSAVLQYLASSHYIFIMYSAKLRKEVEFSVVPFKFNVSLCY